MLRLRHLQLNYINYTDCIICIQDAPYFLYPAQCGPWHWAGEKSLPNYHSARWHSMAFIALAPVLCTSNHASLPPFLAFCLILPFFPTGLRSSTKTSTAARTPRMLYFLNCGWRHFKVTVQPITTQAINASHVFEWLRAGDDVWAHDIMLSFIMQKLKIVAQMHVLNHNDHNLLWTLILVVYMFWFKVEA